MGESPPIFDRLSPLSPLALAPRWHGVIDSSPECSFGDLVADNEVVVDFALLVNLSDTDTVDALGAELTFCLVPNVLDFLRWKDIAVVDVNSPGAGTAQQPSVFENALRPLASFLEIAVDTVVHPFAG